MTTGYIYAPAIGHDLVNHPENGQRGPAVAELLEQEGVLADLSLLSPAIASDEAIRAVHSAAMVELVQEASLRGGGRVDADTYATADSYDLARLAAGSVIQAADALMAGKIDNGFVFVRPPGHHAESKRPGGFCLLNNVAIGARHLQKHYAEIKKVLVLDFDVHHGNGTQEIFYDDETVYFLSIQQHGRFFYPGTGGLHETGQGAGSGFTLNVPLMRHVGDLGYRSIFSEVVAPAVRRFDPDFILISAGYDAHWVDPLAEISLSLQGYGSLSQRLVSLAGEVCDGRILFVQEGGYVLPALAHGVLNSIYALLGRDLIKDPLGPSQNPEPDITNLLTQIKGVHLIK